MCDERETNEEGFGECGLVVWTCEQEVTIRFENRACGQRYYGNIRYVEGSEGCEGVRRVLLYAENYRVMSVLHLHI
jgi:hypothetical protein